MLIYWFCDSIEEFLNFIEASINEESFKKLISQRSQKILTSYRNFINSLVESHCQISINWGSPTPKRGSIRQASLSNASDIVKLLKETNLLPNKNIKIIGKFFKIDIDKFKFGIEDSTRNKKYAGKILNSAIKSASIATINKMYEAEIRIIEKSIVTNSKNIISYELISLEEFLPKYKE